MTKMKIIVPLSNGTKHALPVPAQFAWLSHLPQVAAKGDPQLNVTKTPGQISHTEIQQLDDQQRVMEIARMLSGAKITARTTEHARELLAQSVL